MPCYPRHFSILILVSYQVSPSIASVACYNPNQIVPNPPYLPCDKLKPVNAGYIFVSLYHIAKFCNILDSPHCLGARTYTDEKTSRTVIQPITAIAEYCRAWGWNRSVCWCTFAFWPGLPLFAGT